MQHDGVVITDLGLGPVSDNLPCSLQVRVDLSNKRSAQLLGVVQVLEPPALEFVLDQIGQADDGHRYAIQGGLNFVDVAFGEFAAGDFCQNLNPHGLNTHSDNAALVQEQRFRKLRHVKAELSNE